MRRPDKDDERKNNEKFLSFFGTFELSPPRRSSTIDVKPPPPPRAPRRHHHHHHAVSYPNQSRKALRGAAGTAGGRASERGGSTPKKVTGRNYKFKGPPVSLGDRPVANGRVAMATLPPRPIHDECARLVGRLPLPTPTPADAVSAIINTPRNGDENARMSYLSFNWGLVHWLAATLS